MPHVTTMPSRDALAPVITRPASPLWLEHLRAADPAFAEASALHPDDEGDWQAAVYLLIGCNEVWSVLARDVLAHASIAPVIEELAKPQRGWCLKRVRGDGVVCALLEPRPLARQVPLRLRAPRLRALDHRLPPLYEDHASSHELTGRHTMSLTLPGADVRGFYHDLGIALPDTPRADVSVSCFADPDAHRRADRDPSCSVNTITGAWQLPRLRRARRRLRRRTRQRPHPTLSHRPDDHPRAHRTPRPPPDSPRTASGPSPPTSDLHAAGSRGAARPGDSRNAAGDRDATSRAGRQRSPTASACSPGSLTSAAGATRR